MCRYCIASLISSTFTNGIPKKKRERERDKNKKRRKGKKKNKKIKDKLEFSIHELCMYRRSYFLSNYACTYNFQCMHRLPAAPWRSSCKSL
ncbi:hypothetical protein ACKS23_09662 [Histoplasma ohiense]